jgi:hypothetical protein
MIHPIPLTSLNSGQINQLPNKLIAKSIFASSVAEMLSSNFLDGFFCIFFVSQNRLFPKSRFIMAAYFPSSLISFSQSYGSLVFPIAADFVTAAVFKRATCFGKAQFAGLIAGVGVSYMLASRTSTTIVVTGAALYLIYKLIVCNPPYRACIHDLEESDERLQRRFTFTSEKELNAHDPDFGAQLKALTDEVKPQTNLLREQWKDPHVSLNTWILLGNCQAFLFRIYERLEEATKHLETDPPARLAKMAALFKHPDFDPDKTFDRALLILHRTYRQIRCRGFYLTLPNLKNVPDDGTTNPILGTPLDIADCHLFITGTGNESAMKRTYNRTIDRLGDLLNCINPNSPYNIKDEQLVPGDYDNPTNPFWIFPKTPEGAAE